VVTNHDYEFGNAPIELVQIDGLVERWKDAARTCTNTPTLTMDVGCAPL
jgi:hypothetical protein